MHRILIVVSLLLAAQSTDAPIVWGGDHIELQAGAKGATVEFDCARGTIDAAIAPDSHGHFEIPGTFAPEHAGPVRDDASSVLPATYAGTVKDDAMTLRVTIAVKDAPPPMTYALVRGRAGNVRKCR